jgi:hypothetical protein
MGKVKGKWIAEIREIYHEIREDWLEATGVFHTGTREFRIHEFLNEDFERAAQDDPNLLDTYKRECRELADELNKMPDQGLKIKAWSVIIPLEDV